MHIVFDDSSYTDTALARIDAQCDAARLRVVGDAVRVKEYEVAESQAKAYQAQGYPADVPPFVKVWQDAKHRENWTAQQACDDILAASASWNGALAALRGLRLKTKEDVRAAANRADIDAVLGTFTTTLSVMMQGVV